MGIYPKGPEEKPQNHSCLGAVTMRWIKMNEVILIGRLPIYREKPLSSTQKMRDIYPTGQLWWFCVGAWVNETDKQWKPHIFLQLTILMATQGKLSWASTLHIWYWKRDPEVRSTRESRARSDRNYLLICVCDLYFIFRYQMFSLHFTGVIKSIVTRNTCVANQKYNLILKRSHCFSISSKADISPAGAVGSDA